MATARIAPRFLMLSVVAIGILSCFSFKNSDKWFIKPVPTPSQGAAFYVLNNWQETYSPDAGEMQALGISDIMLKTMGILKDGVSWSGVQINNLFNRPRATALFVVDRLPHTAAFGSLSELSYPIDQTGLCACPRCAGEDLNRMFGPEGVAGHLSGLFDGRSRTLSVSANERAAVGASAQDSYTRAGQVDTLMADIQRSPDTFGLETGTLDLQDEVDLRLVAEVVLVRQAMAALRDGSESFAKDGAPDVFIFTFSTLRAVELKYGGGSAQLKLAVQLVKECIAMATTDLVDLYDGRVLVQGVVLEWKYPEQSSETPELVRAFEQLEPYMGGVTMESFVKALPSVHIDDSKVDDAVALCWALKDVLNPSYTAVCPDRVSPYEGQFYNDRMIRQTPPDEQYNVSTNILTNISDERSENFAAIFLITLFLAVSLGLALFAVSWAMWTMDPGRDSIIYRQVSDPTS